MVVADPDGNELYFPYPASRATGSVGTSNAEQPLSDGTHLRKA
jgi:hypothetical protein